MTEYPVITNQNTALFSINISAEEKRGNPRVHGSALNRKLAEYCNVNLTWKVLKQCGYVVSPFHKVNNAKCR